MASRWMLAAGMGALAAVVVLGGRSDTNAQAVDVDLSKVAVVDVIRIFNECQQTKDVNERFQLRDEKFVDQRQKLKEAVDQKEGELEAFARGSKEYIERFKQWVQLQIDYGSTIKIHQRRIVRDQVFWTRRTYTQIVQAVEEVAKARGLLLVFYRDEMDLQTDDLKDLGNRLRDRKVVFSAAGLDITQEVLDKVNRDYRASGGLKIPSDAK
ncbi:MAG TPA: OmpH family outer membrane protein [Phycisphaerae bacterium]|nr:OmpH family outer membrane protein [Phycisphaerae bacterium]